MILRSEGSAGGNGPDGAAGNDASLGGDLMRPFDIAATDGGGAGGSNSGGGGGSSMKLRRRQEAATGLTPVALPMATTTDEAGSAGAGDSEPLLCSVVSPGTGGAGDARDISPLPLVRRVRRGCVRSGLSWLRLWVVRFFANSSLLGKAREIHLNGATFPEQFVDNAVRFQKYNFLTIVPCVIGHQFHHWFSTIYIVIAMSQFIPMLQIGPFFTYAAPLAFVLSVTFLKELYDDIQRRWRQKTINNAPVQYLDRRTSMFHTKKTSEIVVGDVIKLERGAPVPCDCLLLKTENKSGTTFIRTDQLDGETDWKLRRAVGATQNLNSPFDLISMDAWIKAARPERDIYSFFSTFFYMSGSGGGDGAGEVLGSPAPELCGVPARDLRKDEPGSPMMAITGGGRVAAEGLSLDNALWGSTVVTDGPVYCLVLYTGSEMRSMLNSSVPKYKVGIFDVEANRIAKALLFILIFGAGFLTFARKNYGIGAVVHFARFLLLLSSIIPISLTVNLDVAKAYYSYCIGRDKAIPNTVVRNSNIPEELGRVDVLLTDKTGTLTQNVMAWKKLHLGRVVFGDESLPELREHIKAAFHRGSPRPQPGRRRFEVREQLKQCILALALCHNVTPVVNRDSGARSLQAASPDEIALTTFAADLGVVLISRDEQSIVLQLPDGSHRLYVIKECFPFSSQARKMGIIVQLCDESPPNVPWSVLSPEGYKRGRGARESATPGGGMSVAGDLSLSSEDDLLSGLEVRRGAENGEPPLGEITFYLKGAESVMHEKVERRSSHWVVEESNAFGSIGLRTLVVASRVLGEREFEAWRRSYAAARAELVNRTACVNRVVASIETGLTVLGLTGVEDRLQPGVPTTLEALRHGGINVWMLTGDKVETATCLAIAAGMTNVRQRHNIKYLVGAAFGPSHHPYMAQKEALESIKMGNTERLIVMDSQFIEQVIDVYPTLFVEATTNTSPPCAIICCRCSPEQKANIVKLLQRVTGKRCGAIGDGGNDVPMILASDCGIGVVGKEGKQAALAADFSITEFSHLRRLLLYHGRVAYQGSARLTQFVLHRGLVIATCQMVFCSIFFLVSMPIFQGMLTVGYATYYTMLPVLATVVDEDLPEKIVFMFPELYASLRQGRGMSAKIFAQWLWISVYQGTVIMLGACLLFERELGNIVAVAFTSLIAAELVNASLNVHRWRPTMVWAEFLSVILYLSSMVLLPNYFNIEFIMTGPFWVKVGIITVVSCLPWFVAKIFMNQCLPTRDVKLNT